MSNLFVYKTAVCQSMDIPGYNGKYYVKDDGTVWHRNCWGTKDRRMYGHKRKRIRDFHFVDDQGKMHSVTLSKIMKMTYFKGKVPDGYVLMHVNGMEADWSVWNLKPIPQKELGKLRNRHNKARSVEKVNPITGEVVEIFESARKASESAGCSSFSILFACNKKGLTRPGIAPDGYLYRWEE